MGNSTVAPQNWQEQEIWISLRKAIAKSSGFKTWQQERDINVDGDLDIQVQRYLRETLETLAY